MPTTSIRNTIATMSTKTDPPPTDAADVADVAAAAAAVDVDVDVDVDTAEAILIDLDKDKQLDYWKKRAMKKIHQNCAINEKNVDLREKIGILNTKNQELRQDIQDNHRHKINYLEKIELLQEEIEYLKSRSRRSLLASNNSITEHEIEAVKSTKDKRELLSASNYTITKHEIEAIAKDKRELYSAGKHREIQALIGTSFRSKWSDRFIDESKDE